MRRGADVSTCLFLLAVGGWIGFSTAEAVIYSRFDLPRSEYITVEFHALVLVVLTIWFAVELVRRRNRFLEWARTVRLHFLRSDFDGDWKDH